MKLQFEEMYYRHISGVEVNFCNEIIDILSNEPFCVDKEKEV